MAGKVKRFFHKLKKNMGSLLTAGLFIVPPSPNTPREHKTQPNKDNTFSVLSAIRNFKNMPDMIRKIEQERSNAQDSALKGFWAEQPKKSDIPVDTDNNKTLDNTSNNNTQNGDEAKQEQPKHSVTHKEAEVINDLQLGTKPEDFSEQLSNRDIEAELQHILHTGNTNLHAAIKSHQNKAFFQQESNEEKDDTPALQNTVEQTLIKTTSSAKQKSGLSRILSKLSGAKNKNTSPQKRNIRRHFSGGKGF